MIVVLLLSLIALVCAQTKPNWPMAASASLFIRGFERREDRHMVRWFFDRTAGKERIDGDREFLGERYWTTTILNTNTKREYFIIHQGSLVMCFDRPTNNSIPHPDFGMARYIGKAEYEMNIVDHWIQREGERDVSQIYDRTDNQYVLRIDFDDRRRGHVVRFDFHEWDVGAQDPNLFVVPAPIMAICTNVP